MYSQRKRKSRALIDDEFDYSVPYKRTTKEPSGHQAKKDSVSNSGQKKRGRPSKIKKDSDLTKESLPETSKKKASEEKVPKANEQSESEKQDETSASDEEILLIEKIRSLRKNKRPLNRIQKNHGVDKEASGDQSGPEKATSPQKQDNKDNNEQTSGSLGSNDEHIGQCGSDEKTVDDGSKKSEKKKDGTKKRRFRKTCAVAVCPSPQTPDVMYHVFPKDPEYRDKWLKRVRRADELNMKTAFICSTHFTPNDYAKDILSHIIPNLQKRLKKTAVPSRFLKLKREQEIELNNTSRRKKIIVRSEESDDDEDFEDANEAESEIVYRGLIGDPNAAKKYKKLLEILKLDLEKSMTTKDESKEISTSAKPVEIPEPPFKDVGIQCETATQSVGVECKIEKSFATLEANVKSLTESLKNKTKQWKLLKREVNRLTSKKYKDKLILNELEKNFSPAQARRILKPNLTSFRNYMFNKQDIKTALVLRSLSKKAYNFLQSETILAIPSLPTISKSMLDFNCTRGIQYDCLELIRKKLLNSNSPADKLVIISVGEMNLQKKKGIKKKKAKKIVTGKMKNPTKKKGPKKKMPSKDISFSWGYELTSPNEMSSRKFPKPKVCKTLQVAIIKGVTSSWRQLVYFDFDTKISKALFLEIVRQVEEEIGAEVCAVTCSEEFLSTFNLCVSEHWVQSPVDDSRRIYAFPDVNQMIKLCRNSIIDDGLLLPPDCTSILTRNDFIQLIESLGSGTELKESTHLNGNERDRQKINLATELLSNSTAVSFRTAFGDLKKKQADVLDIISSWYELMHGESLSSTNPSKSAYGIYLQDQLFILTQMEQFALNLQVYGKPIQPWQEGITIGIRSLVWLYEDLKGRFGISSLQTSFFNQGTLESFFHQIKKLSTHYTNPTVYNVSQQIRILLVGENADELITDQPNRSISKKDMTQPEEDISDRTKDVLQSNDDEIADDELVGDETSVRTLNDTAPASTGSSVGKKKVTVTYVNSTSLDHTYTGTLEQGSSFSIGTDEGKNVTIPTDSVLKLLNKIQDPVCSNDPSKQPQIIYLIPDNLSLKK